MYINLIKLIGLILIFSFLISQVKAQKLKPELYFQSGHALGVNLLRFSNDGKILVTGGKSSIKVWDVDNATQIRDISTGDMFFSNIAITKNKKTIITVSSKNKIDYWDIESGTKIRTLEIPNSQYVIKTHLSSDGEILVAAVSTFNIDNDTIFILKVSTGKILYSLKTPYDTQFAPITLSPDKNILSISDVLIDLTTGNQSVLVAPPIENGINEKSQTFATGVGGNSKKMSGAEQIEFSPDSRKLAMKIKRNIVLYNVSISTYSHLIKSDASVFTFSPDSKILAVSTNDEVVLFDVESGKELKRFKNNSSPAKTLGFSPDGKTLATGNSGSTVKLWSILTGNETKSFGVVLESIQSVSLNPKRLILASRTDHTVKLWKPESGNVLNNLKPTFSMSYRPSLGYWRDGNNLMTFTEDGSNLSTFSTSDLLIWKVDSGIVVDKIIFPLGENDLFSLSPNGKMYAQSLNLRRFGIYNTFGVTYGDLEAQKEVLKEKPNEQKIKLLTKNFNQDNSELMFLTFSPDGKLLLTLAKNFKNGTNDILVTDRTLTVRNVEDNEVLTSISGSFEKFALSYDGLTLATTEIIGNRFNQNSISKISIWNIKNQNLIKEFNTNIKLTDGCFIFSPDGKVLAATFENTIKLWDLEFGSEIKTLSGHTGVVTSISFSSDGKLMVSGSLDGSIKIWDVKTARELGSLYSINDSDWIVTTPEGLFDGTPNAWSQILWRFDNNSFSYAPVEAFFKEFYYPGLLQEIMRGKTPQPPEKDLSAVDIRQPKLKIGEIGDKTENSVETKTVKVQIEIEDNREKGRKSDFPASSGAFDLRLFRNGSLVRLWKKRGNASDKSASVFDLSEADGCRQIVALGNAPRKAVCETEVTITAGQNDFTAYAFNHDNVKSIDATASIEGKFTKKSGTLYVLAVGVNEYKNELKNLEFAVPDADAIAKEIGERQKTIQPAQYATTEIVKLTDENATRANILAAIRRFNSGGEKMEMPKDLSPTTKTEIEKIKSAAPEDALIIYFAGHGTARCETSADGRTNCDRFYLIPHDGFPTEEMSDKDWLAAVYQKSISDEDLADALETVDAGKILFIIDACESGQALDAEEKRRGPMNSRGLAQLAYEKGMYILTAAQSQQAALETSKLGHGLLTYSLLEGFQKADGNEDKQIIEREWFDFAARQVPVLQLDAMQQRNAENRGAGNKKKTEITVVPGDDPNADPEKRSLQTPRIFYRREESSAPFVVSKP